MLRETFLKSECFRFPSSIGSKIDLNETYYTYVYLKTILEVSFSQRDKFQLSKWIGAKKLPSE